MNLQNESPLITRRQCLTTAAGLVTVAGLSGLARPVAAQQPQSKSNRDAADASPMVIKPGGATQRSPSIELHFENDLGMAQWWIPELLMPGHTDIGRRHVGENVAWHNDSVWWYEHTNSADGLKSRVEIRRVDLGWLAQMTISNLSTEVWRDAVGVVCLLLHASREFVDPDWQRTYYRTGGEYRKYSQVSRAGELPTYQMSLANGLPQIGRSERHIRKWEFTQQPSDDGTMGVVSRGSGTVLVTRWRNAHHLQSNRRQTFHCIHSNPFLGTIQPGASVTTQGCVLLVPGTLNDAWREASKVV